MSKKNSSGGKGKGSSKGKGNKTSKGGTTASKDYSSLLSLIDSINSSRTGFNSSLYTFVPEIGKYVPKPLLSDVNEYIKSSGLGSKSGKKDGSKNKETKNTLGGTFSTFYSGNGTEIKKNMRLFGLPYQFREAVDNRTEKVSKIIGRKFIENIILDAPVITIIPGRPKYLPGSKNKKTLTQSSLLAGATDDLSTLQKLIGTEASTQNFKYYGFETAYTEYMSYVNILARACASFLEIGTKIDGVGVQSYDWRNWSWTTDSYLGNTSATKQVKKILSSSTSKIDAWLKANYQEIASGLGININEKTTASSKGTNFVYETTTSSVEGSVSLEEYLSAYNFLQFYVDVDSGSSESMTNTTTESKLKGIFDTGSDVFKELAFVMNSGGIDPTTMQTFASGAASSLSDALGNIGGSLTSPLSRVLSLSSNVIKGENVIMPDIYQSSGYDKSYSFTVHLKTPYGNRLGYFLDICVPLMHLLALGIPKQTTANTYGAPFLIKCYQEGAFNCNLGIVTSISINKGQHWSADGLPTEVDVTLTIADLYSDLTMSPQTSPILFINNTSLVEYLATTCGLSLVAPNLSKRMNLITNTVKNSFKDLPSNVSSSINETINGLARDFLNLN